MANLFGTATPGSNTNQNAGAPGITTGTRLRFAVAATITAVRWRCPDTAPAAASWIVVAYVPATDSAGTGLGSGSFGALTPGAWNTAACSIAVSAGDEIVVEVWNSEGRYVNETGYFAADVVVGNLTGPADDALTPRHNGRFNIGGSITFPTDGFAQNAYFVDVEYTASGTTWTAGSTDSAGLTDPAAIARTNTVTDPAGLTDTAALSRTSAVTDPSGLTDAYALTQAPAVTDTVGLTDGILSTRTLAPTDSAGLSDVLGYAQAHVYTDPAGLTDPATAQGGAQEPPAEWRIQRPRTAWAAHRPHTAYTSSEPYMIWAARRPRGGQTAMSGTIVAETIENVYADISAHIADVAIDPTVHTVQLAVMAGDTRPGPGDWLTAAWITNSSTTPPTYSAYALAGPFTVGTIYTIYAKISAAPETPWLRAGQLKAV